jgi:hypothetical protein
MNKMTVFLLVVIMVLSFSLGTTMQSRAQERSFPGVLPFFTNDHVGFFDQSNGKVYIYDSNLTNCLFIGQVQALGQPLNIKTDNSTTTNT